MILEEFGIVRGGNEGFRLRAQLLRFAIEVHQLESEGRGTCFESHVWSFTLYCVGVLDHPL